MSIAGWKGGHSTATIASGLQGFKPSNTLNRFEKIGVNTVGLV